MTGKAHRVGGMVAGIVTSTLLFSGPFEEKALIISVPLIIMSVVGSLLPDLDHPSSTLGRKFKFISYPLSSVFGHRGFIHSPFFCLLIGLLMQFFYDKVPVEYQHIYLGMSLGVFVGYLSHLALDFLTVSGIPLLSPISKKKYRLMKLKSGRHESIVMGTLAVVATASICLNWF